MGNIRYIANVLNQKGAPAIFEDLAANRPSAGYIGRIFISTDTFVIQRDNGTTWDNLNGAGNVTGTGVIGQVSFWGSTSGITGDNTFFWDNTNKRLGLGTITPGVRLDVHGTGVIQQLNGTTTNNAYLDFQNAGSTQWRIGNFYNGAIQSFIINNAATSNILTITQTGSTTLNGSFAAASCSITASNGISGQFTNNATSFETVQIINNGSGNLLSLRNSGGVVAVVSNNGSFGSGTGTITAGYQMDVTGSIPLVLNSTSSAASNTFGAINVRRQTNTVGNGNGLAFSLYNSLNAYAEYAYIGSLIETNTSGAEFGSLIFAPISSSVRTIRATLLSSGNFGIGYNTPAVAFAVSGSIYQGSNTANALYEMFCNGNLYTGGLSPTVLTVGSNTTMVRTATGYRCTATLTLTLPVASGLNNIYYVIANTGATVTVQRNGTDTIVDKTGTTVTSVTVAAGTRTMFYVGGGTEIFQIF